MKRCNAECEPICDFCILYQDNCKQVTEGIQIFTGEGYCTFHDKVTDPGEDCDDFICMNYHRLDPLRKD